MRFAVDYVRAPGTQPITFTALRIEHQGLRCDAMLFLSWRPLYRLFGRDDQSRKSGDVCDLLSMAVVKSKTHVFPALNAPIQEHFRQEGSFFHPEDHTKKDWFLSVQAMTHLVLRFVMARQKDDDFEKGRDFLTWLLSEKLLSVFPTPAVTSRARRSSTVSAQESVAEHEPMTPVLMESIAAVPAAPVFKRSRLISADVDQPLTPIGPARPEVPIFVAATYPVSPDAVVPVAPGFPVQAPKRLISRELDDVADANSSVPVKKSLGGVAEVAFEFLYPGKFALQQRLEAAGHLFEPAKLGATRGPWRILFRALGRDQVNLQLHKRLSEGILSVDFGRKGEKCSAKLTMQEHIVQSVVDVIRRPRSVDLPSKFASFAPMIASDRSLFPLTVRADPSTAVAATFRPLYAECAILSLALVEKLISHVHRCRTCNQIIQDGISVCRDSFYRLTVSYHCRCGSKGDMTDLTGFLQADESNCRRAKAFACSLFSPATEVLGRIDRLCGLPYTRLRLGADRLSVSRCIFSKVVAFGERHYKKQMSFLKEASKGHNDPLILQAADVELDEVNSGSGVVAGDGQHSRQTRKGFGNAPVCVVTIVNVETGAVVLQVIIDRTKLGRAVEQEGEADEDCADGGEPKKKHSRQERVFRYMFDGLEFRTAYLQAEAAGVEIALQILKQFVGQNCLKSVVYDQLSCVKNLVAKYLPETSKSDDSWHVHRSLLSELETMEKDKDFVGLKKDLGGQVNFLLRDTEDAAEVKKERLQTWKFLDGRKLEPDKDKKLKELLKKISDSFDTLSPGFATSLVESFFSTHDSFWEKGKKYGFEARSIKMTCQALHWNREKDWANQLFAACSEILRMKE